MIRFCCDYSCEYVLVLYHLIYYFIISNKLSNLFIFGNLLYCNLINCIEIEIYLMSIFNDLISWVDLLSVVYVLFLIFNIFFYFIFLLFLFICFIILLYLSQIQNRFADIIIEYFKQ